MPVKLLNFYLEERRLTAKENLPTDLARHIYARQLEGVAIFCDNPKALISPVRKTWLAIIKTLEKEYAYSIDANRKAEVTKHILWMRTLEFTININNRAGVYFLNGATDYKLRFNTIYLVKKYKLEDMAAYTAKNSLLVRYL